MEKVDTSNDWDQIMKSKFKLYDVEKSIDIQSQRVVNGPVMFVQYICEALHPGNVPNDLHKLYKEAVYGMNAKVKSKIINCIYIISEKVRYALIWSLCIKKRSHDFSTLKGHNFF